MKNYKEAVPDENSRRSDSENLIKNYPDRVPIILEPYKCRQNVFNIGQTRFLVPKLYSFHEFIFHIRRKVDIKKTDSLYLIVGENYFPAMNRTMSSIYNEFKDPDGFLYMTYSSQPVWGCVIQVS